MSGTDAAISDGKIAQPHPPTTALMSAKRGLPPIATDLAGAILLRAMVPLSQPPQTDLAGKPVLIVSGQHDPIIPAANAARLAALLTDAGAKVQHRLLPVGHQLSQADLTIGREWMSAVGILQTNPAPAN
jgi:phospholipase/carboxylesterase